MKKTLLKLIVLSFLFLSPLSAGADTITGRVIKSDGNPVAKAEVALKTLKAGKSGKSQTDREGRFSFKNLETGYYAITVSAENLCSETLSRIEVNQAKYGIKNYEVTLLRPGSINGCVYDETGGPLPETKIRGNFPDNFTDNHGFYRLKSLRPGSYYLTAEKRGFVRTSQNRITVKENGETGGVNFNLLAGGTISGQVLDKATGKTIKEVWVNSEGGTYQSAKTDGSGKFEIWGLLPGRYKISAYTQGYEGGFAGNIEVKKGTTVSIPLIPLELRPRYFNLTRRTWTFQPSEKVFLQYNAFRVEKAEIKIYPVDLPSEINKNRDFPADLTRLVEKIDLKNQNPILLKNCPITYPKPLSDIYEHRFNLEALPLGAYLVVARPENLPEQRLLILVTDLALTTKSGPNQLLVYACSLSSGKPIESVNLSFLSFNWQIAFIDKTNSSGIFQTTRDLPQYILAQEGKNIAFISRNNSFREAANPIPEKTYLYTDRPVYRPEQTVYFKGILRKDEGTNYTSPGRKNIQIKVMDPTDNLFYQENSETAETGSFHGSFSLPEEPALGTYQIEILSENLNQHYGSAQFKVLEYRKPEYFVGITADKDRYLPGETIRILVTADYYFGEPVKEAEVNYTVYQKSKWEYEEEDGEFEGGDAGYGWGYGSFLLSGQAKTDENGKVLVEIPTRDAYDNETFYTIEAGVVDQSRREIKGISSCLVVPGNIRIKINTSKFLYTPEEEIPVKISVSDYEDRPVISKKVALEIGREIYRNRKISYRSILTRDFLTDSEGKIEIKINPKVQGYLKVSALGSDEYHNLVSGNRYIWIAGSNYTSDWYGRKELEIVPDQKKYRPGDTARILINSSYPDIPVLITLENYRIQESRVLNLKGCSALIEIPLKQEYLPNIYLSVSAVQHKKFYDAVKSLDISPEEKFLKVEIIPEKNNYQPGEKAGYEIRTSGLSGKPIAAEFSFGLVDEAIYAISPEMVPSIENFFYGRKPDFISTNYSFYEWAYGGAGKDLPNAEVRRKFKDTAYWQPVIFTDNSGKAKLELELPDNLTTWRATCRAITPETEVGTGTQKIVTSKPLIARLITPRFMVEDDQLLICGVIHNYTLKTQELVVTLTAEGAEILDGKEKTVSLKPGEEARNDWKVKAGPGPLAKFTLQAKNSEVSDGMELSIPTLAYGVQIQEVKAGQCRDSVKDIFTIPTEAVSPRLTTYLYPSLASGLFHGLDYLASFPYGCVEQTLNRFLPTIYVSRAIEKLGSEKLSFLADSPSGFQSMLENLPSMVSQGLTRLYRYQHSDGGWGWWEYDGSHPYVSAYTVFGLIQTRKSGYLIDENRLERGKQYLKNTLPVISDWDTRMYIAFALAETGENMETACSDLYQNQKYLNSYSLALLALTFKKYNGPRSREILDELYRKIQYLTPDSAFWTVENEGSYRWVDSNIEATAWALKAGLEINPQSPEIPKIIRYLVKMRRLGRWRSTKDTAVCVYVLTGFLTENQELSPNIDVLLTVNEKEVAEKKLDRKTLKEFATELVTPDAFLKTGSENTVALTKKGSGDFYYSHNLNYLIKNSFISARNEGFQVVRVYQKARLEKDENGNILEKYEDTTGPLRVGEKIRVKLTVSGKDFYEFAVIEDPLPSGFEVLEEKNPEDGWGYWYCRREIRDEKIAFFTPVWGEKNREITYYLRPEVPGIFHLLPTRVSLMYFPEVYGNSEEGFFKVTEK